MSKKYVVYFSAKKDFENEINAEKFAKELRKKGYKSEVSVVILDDEPQEAEIVSRSFGSERERIIL